MRAIVTFLLAVLIGAVALGFLFAKWEETKADLERTTSERDGLAQALAARDRRIKELETQTGQLRAEVQHLTTQNAAWEHSVAQCTAEKTKTADELARLQAASWFLQPLDPARWPPLVASAGVLAAGLLVFGVAAWGRLGGGATPPPLGLDDLPASEAIQVTLSRDDLKRFLAWRRQHGGAGVDVP